MPRTTPPPCSGDHLSPANRVLRTVARGAKSCASWKAPVARPYRCRKSTPRRPRRKPVITVSLAGRQPASQGLSGSLEPALLTLQAGENLPLPALLDALDLHRGDVARHPVLEPRAEQSMHVRVGRAVLAAVLMDREDALGTSSDAAESLLDGVTKDALRKVSVEPLEALGRGVVDRQDEAEVDRVPDARPGRTRGLAKCPAAAPGPHDQPPRRTRGGGPAEAGTVVGFDLEAIEPRSGTFLEEYFTVEQQAPVRVVGPSEAAFRATSSGAPRRTPP